MTHSIRVNLVFVKMCVFLRGEGEVSGSYKASGIPLKPLRITPDKGVVPVPGSLLPRMAPVDQQIQKAILNLKSRIYRESLVELKNN